MIPTGPNLRAGHRRSAEQEREWLKKDLKRANRHRQLVLKIRISAA
jgi:hypothetical protein